MIFDIMNTLNTCLLLSYLDSNHNGKAQQKTFLVSRQRRASLKRGLAKYFLYYIRIGLVLNSIFFFEN